MNQALNGKRVAILATDGFEESELSVPRAALQKEGVEVHIVSPEGKGIRAWAETDWGDTYEADKALADVSESDYHALVLPGGLFNPDELRLNEDALSFVKAFFQAGKPVAANQPPLGFERPTNPRRSVTSGVSPITKSLPPAVRGLEVLSRNVLSFRC